MERSDIAMVLSGGIALGAYQGGAYAALHEAHGRQLSWLAGSSTGAINAAIIAGNEPDRRVAMLEAFWRSAALPLPDTRPLLQQSSARQLHNWLVALQTRMMGRTGIFSPRPAAELLLDDRPSLYDLLPLGRKLEAFIDFRRLNEGEVRLSVATTDVTTGEMVVFDTARRSWIEPVHLLASCGFMPEFPPVEIDGRLLGDGGLVANAPVEIVLDEKGRKEPLTCFLVDLFARYGERPTTLLAAAERRLDLLLAGQTKRALDGLVRASARRENPGKSRQSTRGRTDGDGRTGDAGALVLHLAYRAVPATANVEKLFDFSPASIADRWASGSADMEAALKALRRLPAVGPGELVLHEVHRPEAV